jgi:LPS-assembly protein
MTAEERRIDINNIYSFNRIGVSDTVEGGASMTLGLKYKKINKNNFGKYINLEFANVLRHKKNEDLSIVSTLGETQSDFFGDLEIKPNKNFDMSYNFALNNNLKQSNYDSIKTNFSLNNFATSFEYIDDKKSVGQKSYLANNTSIKIDDNGSVGFNLRRNNDTSATEFYDLYYSYANDCLEAAITYNKSYYSDSDLEPETQLFLSVTIIPFGTVNSPDITN